MWQPIDTAPKDGTEIVVCAEGQTQYGDRPCVASFHNARWLIADIGFNNDDSRLHYTPTHWMPLPAPPQEDAPLNTDATWPYDLSRP